MCFSASASFIAAGFLSTIAIATLHRATRPQIKPVALLPLFFGIQQGLEGLVWISLNAPGDSLWWHIIQGIGIYGFVFFAALFWPIWIPYALYCVEENTSYRKLLYKVVITQLILAAVYIISWHFTPIIATNINCHIAYSIFSMQFSWLAYNPTSLLLRLGLNFVKAFISIAYLSATAFVFFGSSIPYAKVMGTLILAAYVVAELGYRLSFASVWCFFAAVISMLTYYVVYTYQKRA